MSYTGNDDQPTCDVCLRVYPPPWPAGFYDVWPVVGPLLEADGRVPADQADTFHICLTCLQSAVLSARLTRAKRALALRSKDRWEASRRLLAELKAIALDAA